MVQGCAERYILYCDDPSFNADEPGYQALKAALDGDLVTFSVIWPRTQWPRGGTVCQGFGRTFAIPGLTRNPAKPQETHTSLPLSVRYRT